MTNVIHITKAFPPTRQRTVLVELLKTVRRLRDESIEVIICGGWVPFLKDLARCSASEHSMSLDIDVLFPESSREKGTVDRVRDVLLSGLSFKISNEASSKLEKRVGGDLVQLDLLADVARGRDGNAVLKVYGEATSLDLALLDGGTTLMPHLEQITITHQEEDASPEVYRTTITVPNAIGFLMLKAEVTKFRQKEKDPYDIFYYCTHCETPENIRKQMQISIDAPGVRETVRRLRYLFQYPDSDWVARVLDHGNVRGLEREREALKVVRTIARAIEGLA